VVSSTPYPTGGSYSIPLDSAAGGEGLAAPPQEPLPHCWPSLSLEFWPFQPHECPQDKFLAMPVGSVINQKFKIVATGSTSKKVEKNTGR